MCLYVGKKVALVAKKDITVYKFLKPSTIDSEWKSPCQNTPVELNKVMKPARKSKEVFETSCHKYQINGGVIHACLITNMDDRFGGCTCFEATIKKGTTYYVQDDFIDIAAEEIYISDKKVEGDTVSPNIKEICDDYMDALGDLREFTNKDGIKIGYLYLTNGTYVSPKDTFEQDDVIGIVAFFDKNDNPIVTALEDVSLPWLTQYDMRNKIQSDIKDTEKDFDGKKHTADIASSKDYDKDKFKAIAYCLDYDAGGKTKKGEWYLGATGEMIEMAKNLGVINATIIYTGIGSVIRANWTWTSSEVSYGHIPIVWYCRLEDGICDYCYYRYDEYQVRPCAAFINEA